MTTSLLQTKLYIPPIREDLVRRPRLIERLDEGQYPPRRLTLVSAPAGFGKTTLLAEWAASRGARGPVAWLSLDEDDNDPTRFLAHLIGALQKALPNLGQDGLGMPSLLPSSPAVAGSSDLTEDDGRGGGRGGERMPELLTTLINQIDAVGPEPSSGQTERSEASMDPRADLVLVFDDYHVINSPTIHAALEFLLEHMPGSMHLVIATRSDPPLFLSRLRGRGQLTELRQSDLRFTLDQVTEFLNRAVGPALGTDDLAALAARTEGWIAGLQMAALSMQARRGAESDADLAAFVKAFTGSHHFIMDYLIEEVLDQQSPEIQEFLLKTSILDHLTGPLCDAVLHGKGDTDAKPPRWDSAAILDRLAHANLFLIPLDETHSWFRYHHLFAELLHQRLNQAHLDLIPTLHRRASQWYQGHELWAPAIDHALEAGDFERAADLIESAAEVTWKRSELVTFLGWVDALPDDVVRTRPELCLYHALVLLLSGQPFRSVEARLQDIQGAGDDRVSDGLVIVRALTAAYRGDSRRSVALSEQILELLPPENLFLRSFVVGVLGMAQVHGGDTKAALQTLEQAAQIGEQAGNVMSAVLALSHLAEISALQGLLGDAQAHYERALALAVDRQGRRLPAAGVALMGLGELLRQRRELQAAERYLEDGITLAKRGQRVTAMRGYLSLARLKQAQGDPAGARASIRAAGQMARQFDAMEMDDELVATEQARLWIAQGDLTAAEGWATRWAAHRAARPTLNVPSGERPSWSFLLGLFKRSTLARLRLAQERPEEALRLLDTAETGDGVPPAFQIELLLLRALALGAAGNRAGALIPLERALSLAEPGGYVSPFVEAGRPMARLLYAAAERGIHPDYVSRLLAAFPTEGPAAAPSPAAEELIEPLSERELEILQLIDAGLSNREIAQRLYLSEHTVKWHSSNIYGKLGVNNRTQASARARGLGLLAASPA